MRNYFDRTAPATWSPWETPESPPRRPPAQRIGPRRETPGRPGISHSRPWRPHCLHDSRCADNPLGQVRDRPLSCLPRPTPPLCSCSPPPRPELPTAAGGRRPTTKDRSPTWATVKRYTLGKAFFSRGFRSLERKRVNFPGAMDGSRTLLAGTWNTGRSRDHRPEEFAALRCVRTSSATSRSE